MGCKKRVRQKSIIGIFIDQKLPKMIQKIFILNGQGRTRLREPMSGLNPDAIDKGVSGVSYPPNLADAKVQLFF